MATGCQAPPLELWASPLRMQGGGNGYQDCDKQIACPTAMPAESGAAGLHQFAAPVMRGGGSNMPGLLGLKSLEQH